MLESQAGSRRGQYYSLLLNNQPPAPKSPSFLADGFKILESAVRNINRGIKFVLDSVSKWDLPPKCGQKLPVVQKR